MSIYNHQFSICEYTYRIFREDKPRNALSWIISMLFPAKYLKYIQLSYPTNPEMQLITESTPFSVQFKTNDTQFKTVDFWIKTIDRRIKTFDTQLKTVDKRFKN